MVAQANPQAEHGKVVTVGRGHRPRRDHQTVAYLTNQLPFPDISGGQVREAQTLLRLAERFDIHLGIVTSEFERDLAALDEVSAAFASVTLAPNLGGTDPAAHRDRVGNPEFVRQWAQVVRSADLAHVEGYFMMPSLPRRAGLGVLLVEENIEFCLHRSFAGESGPPEATWHRTRREEIAAWRSATLVGAVTLEDVRAITQAAPDITPVHLPNGWDHLAFQPAGRRDAPSEANVLFTGNFSWAPTRDAATFLLNDIWPILRQAHPSCRLVLAGASPTPTMKRAARRDPRVRVTGQVPTLRPYLENATVYLCPIRFGGGIKVKLVEALYSGQAIVTTPSAMQGLGNRYDDAVLVAQTASDLAAATLTLLNDSRRRKQLAALASAAVPALPTWDEAAAQLGHAWNRAAENRREAPHLSLSVQTARSTPCLY